MLVVLEVGSLLQQELVEVELQQQERQPAVAVAEKKKVAGQGLMERLQGPETRKDVHHHSVLHGSSAQAAKENELNRVSLICNSNNKLLKMDIKRRESYIMRISEFFCCGESLIFNGF